ncbi:hypothetical protein AYJ54_36370 [Bradyrhizobium centrolobii]|uniref:Uncharacterized protein n=1 Tax=Bradyrhizobium centrolobii TaxID=1505087 RepID=A0A176Y758_9BRAD|nr:hypothetical protein [Bradyrhizobium centrolobii]OAE96758.1 hypothetical protein AYJ54_36370 [Bradyrhizobium centrolobii]
MPADTYNSNLGLILQGTGNNNNWGAVINNSMIPTDRAIAGVATRGNTGGTLDLSSPRPGVRLHQNQRKLAFRRKSALSEDWCTSSHALGFSYDGMIDRK